MNWTEAAGEPTFPPLFTGRQTVPGLSACGAAVSGARDGVLTAGDVLWEADPTRVALAVVLEPEVSLHKAAQMLPLAMVAVADCIGSLAPPKVGVMFRWPGTVTVNGAVVGAVRVVVPRGDLDAVPDWLVVSVDLRMRLAADAAEPGRSPEATTLADEGCDALSYTDVMASFSKHFLTWLDLWESDQFRPVHRSWAERAESTITMTSAEGAEVLTVAGMDDDGNLLVRGPDGAVRSLALADEIEVNDGSLRDA